MHCVSKKDPYNFSCNVSKNVSNFRQNCYVKFGSQKLVYFPRPFHSNTVLLVCQD